MFSYLCLLICVHSPVFAHLYLLICLPSPAPAHLYLFTRTHSTTPTNTRPLSFSRPPHSQCSSVDHTPSASAELLAAPAAAPPGVCPLAGSSGGEKTYFKKTVNCWQQVAAKDSGGGLDLGAQDPAVLVGPHPTD